MKMPGFREIDSPVQMRLYTLTKHRFAMVFISFVVTFFVVLMIGILGPQAIDSNSVSARALGVPVKKFKTGPYLINSGTVSRFNQELWLFVDFQLNKLPLKEDYTLEREFEILVKLVGSSKDTSYRVVNYAYYNRTRSLKCTIKSCKELVVFHLGTLNYPSYIIDVSFYGLDLPDGVSLKNVLFTFKYYSEEFTQIEIWFRFVFLVLAFTVCCMFIRGLKQFPVREWCIEQKWMSILLPLLLLYNNPMFSLNFLVKSSAPAIFDIIFQGTFFSGLLLFWLCAYHGIRQNNRRCLWFYLPKLIIVGLIFLIGIAILGWQKVNELRDPSYQYTVDASSFMILKIFVFIVGGVYLIYLVVLLVQAFQELRNMPYFDVRLKFLTVLMLLVVLISLVAVFIRFGTAVLQDAFVMDVTSTYKNSTEFLAFFGLFNIYLYIMAFMYSPSPNALRDINRMKTSASSFSIIADSEDELVTYDRLKGDEKEHGENS